MKTEEKEWEKDILLTAIKSDKTKSGLEVVYDPYVLIDTVSQLLQQRDKELVKKMVKKIEKICTYKNAKFDIPGVYTDAQYRGLPQEPIDLINRWDVYKAITNNECTYGYSKSGPDLAYEEIISLLENK